jgi:hypothetical protein
VQQGKVQSHTVPSNSKVPSASAKPIAAVTQARVTEATAELVAATEALYESWPRPNMASLKAVGH